MALERISENAAFCFLLTSDKASQFCFCIGLTLPCTLVQIPLGMDCLSYLAKIDKIQQEKLGMARRAHEQLCKDKELQKEKELDKLKAAQKRHQEEKQKIYPHILSKSITETEC